MSNVSCAISYAGGASASIAIAGAAAVAGKKHRIKGWRFEVVAVGAQNAAGAQVLLNAGAYQIAAVAFGPAQATLTRLTSHYGPCDIPVAENTAITMAYSTAGAETVAIVGHVEIGYD